MEVLLNFGQLHYYAAQGYEWDEVKDELLQFRETPPEPAPEPDADSDEDSDEDTDFSEITWMRNRA